MFANLNDQLVQILYKSLIKKLEIDFNEIKIRKTHDHEIPEKVEEYKNKSARIMLKDDSGNTYELTGKGKDTLVIQ
ncbi:MAG: hypothetical protein PG981_001182 [Wolbachia endosymbiont of Ctenocephalides orientis wCori]|nr:MAG: hypothetical protein PG981_001182 [Wolbachia endosymbiont of Ctenocephalides orientis wCori]